MGEAGIYNLSNISSLNSPLFRGIEQDKIRIMLECMGGNVRKFCKDEIIFLNHNAEKYVSVVLSGRVFVVKSYPDGEQSLLTIIETGEIFGESFAVNANAAEYATFIAAEDVVLLYIPYKKIMHVCNNKCPFHYQMMENILELFVSKSVRLIQKVDIMTRKTLREKIIAYLQNEQRTQNSKTITLTTSRTVWAEYLGVNRSALARELSNMKKEGILDYDKNTITLKNIYT